MTRALWRSVAGVVALTLTMTGSWAGPAFGLRPNQEGTGLEELALALRGHAVGSPVGLEEPVNRADAEQILKTSYPDWQRLAPERQATLINQYVQEFSISYPEWTKRLMPLLAVREDDRGYALAPNPFPPQVPRSPELIRRGQPLLSRTAFLLGAGGAGTRLFRELDPPPSAGSPKYQELLTALALNGEQFQAMLAQRQRLTKPTFPLGHGLPSPLAVWLTTLARMDPSASVIIGLSLATEAQIVQFLQEVYQGRHGSPQGTYFGLQGPIALVSDAVVPVLDARSDHVLAVHPRTGDLYKGGAGGAGSLEALGRRIKVLRADGQVAELKQTGFEWLQGLGKRHLYVGDADTVGTTPEQIYASLGLLEQSRAPAVAFAYPQPDPVLQEDGTSALPGRGRLVTVTTAERAFVVNREPFEMDTVEGLPEAVQAASGARRWQEIPANAGIYLVTLNTLKRLVREGFPWHVGPPRQVPELGYEVRRFEKFKPDLYELLASRDPTLSSLPILELHAGEVVPNKSPEELAKARERYLAMEAEGRAELFIERSRGQLQAIRQQLLETSRNGPAPNGLVATQTYADAIENVLRQAVEIHSRSWGSALEPFAIALVGSSGRGQMNFRSDVDYLLVHDEGADTDRLRELEVWVRNVFGQLGFEKVSPFAQGTIGYIIDWSRFSLIDRLALDDMRFVAGDRPLFEALNSRVRQEFQMPPQATQIGITDGMASAMLDLWFVYKRYEGYSGFRRPEPDPEPDVKKGPGGVRDTQFVIQMAKIRYGSQAQNIAELLEDIVRQGGMTSAEGEQLASAFDFLYALRNELHDLKSGDVTGDALDRLDTGSQQVLAGRALPWVDRDVYQAWRAQAQVIYDAVAGMKARLLDEVRAHKGDGWWQNFQVANDPQQAHQHGRLAGDPDPYIQLALAWTSQDPEVLRKVFSFVRGRDDRQANVYWNILFALAHSAHVPEDVYRNLLEYTDRGPAYKKIPLEVVRNPSVPRKVIEELVNRPEAPADLVAEAQKVLAGLEEPPATVTVSTSPATMRIDDGLADRATGVGAEGAIRPFLDPTLTVLNVPVSETVTTAGVLYAHPGIVVPAGVAAQVVRLPEPLDEAAAVLRTAPPGSAVLLDAEVLTDARMTPAVRTGLEELAAARALRMLRLPAAVTADLTDTEFSALLAAAIQGRLLDVSRVLAVGLEEGQRLLIYVRFA